jgi:addiction module RelB/DinJ family antitoxin
MNSTTVLSVKVNKELKEQAQALALSMGLPVSTIISAGLREFVRTRSITFSEAPQLKHEVEADLLALSKNARQGKDVSPAFDNLSDALAWLDA